jgi:HTH-type transcriptional regulator/antitoxin HigA
MDANPGSKQEEELEFWSLLVERYEQEHHPIDFPDPIEAIRFRMEQEGLRQKDLAKYFPGKNRVIPISRKNSAFSTKSPTSKVSSSHPLHQS